MPQMNNPYYTAAGRLSNSHEGQGIVADLRTGAQLGFGNNLPNIDASTPLVMRPIVAIVTHAPTMFRSTPGMAEILKSLVENHARTIDGIDVQYTIDPGTTPAGQDGQELNFPTNAKRAQVNPSMTFQEVLGNLVWNFFRTWMRMIKDPDTQASSLAGIIDGTAQIPPHVLSMFTMDVLFIQYDTTMQPQNIIDAYFITSMWPNDTGPAGFKKQIGDSQMAERTIAFHGVLQHNENTKAVGQRIATILNLHKVDYNFATPVAVDRDSELVDAGLEQTANADIANFRQVV